MVFQHFNLFPHMTILKNMTIAPMKLLKKSEAEATEKAMELLKRVGLEDRMRIPLSFRADRSSVSPLCVRFAWSLR